MERGTLKMDANRPLSDNCSPGNPPEIDIALALPTQDPKNRPILAAQV
jgi:hypothetical protein